MCVRRYISILPVIPVTLHLSSQEAIEMRHPQDTQHAPRVSARTAQLQTDLTLYKSVSHHDDQPALYKSPNINNNINNIKIKLLRKKYVIKYFKNEIQFHCLFNYFQ